MQYTEKNLQFAVTVEPQNSAVVSKLQWAQTQRQQGKAAIPSTIAEELSYNPFMRVQEAALQVGMCKSKMGQHRMVNVGGLDERWWMV